jgi:hypothetical protein
MPEIHTQDLPTLRAAALAEHYQNTMELVTHHWERRSRQFVTLVAVLAGAALVAFARPLIAPALKAAFLRYVPLPNKEDLARLDALTPVAGDLILAFLVVTVFYLTASLVNRTSIITNYYVYLQGMEPEIRTALQLSSRQVSFTREGDFYEATGADISRLIRRCYRSILGFLLIFFFAARLFFDFPQDLPPLRAPDRELVLELVAKCFLFVVDVVVFVATLRVFVRFAPAATDQEARQRLEALTSRA